ncbi:hypothetical protein PMI27_004241 [Pseudomonas sp. GM41(2012)]|jgi:hypothetical protein|uniref:hypothetical protein n=1 Tax=Pseudomonas sp. (strain GM41(2012)) TaxID=1144708 RepID=UPI0002703282|nr:hypothetical protein [Pseudomonas sp. GM41(2012)]EUB72319.1 hypothetical protein PMI27_004241 [Pseudomonas sp. GM41(2012)]
MSEVLLVDQARQCSALFRLGRDVEAALVMVEVAERVQSRVGGADSQIAARWMALLTCLLDSQERQDWLALADYLEYELVDLLLAVNSA